MARTSSINKYRQQQLIKLKGTKCINCNTDCGDNIIFHHVIPISIGGTENNSNIVPLCTNCHRKLHNISQKNSTISHSELVRAGIKKAKEKGIKVGRKSITINDIPIEFYTYYNKTLSNELSITAAAQQMQISRTTFYHYKKIIEEQNQE